MTTFDLPERRRVPRVKAPVYCRSESVCDNHRRVINVSSAGLRMYADRAADVGQEIELDMILGDEDAISTKARVVWSRPLPELAPFACDLGIELTEMDERDVEKLELFLERYQADKPLEVAAAR